MIKAEDISVRLPVIEIFGPTIQGEGTDVGRVCVFVRFAGCDYNCEWCDTKYANDGDIGRPMTVQEISDKITELIFGNASSSERQKRNIAADPLVVLTGGNPCIHNLSSLIRKLHNRKYNIHIETQGSVVPAWIRSVDQVNISPKPPSSGHMTDLMDIEKFIQKCGNYLSGPEIVLKVVIFNIEDYAYAKRVHQAFKTLSMVLQVGNDVGQDSYVNLITKLRGLTEKVCADKEWGHNIRILPQLHTLIWGNKRGV